MQKKRRGGKNLSVFSAQDETRTHTILRPLPPQSSVYTNFTTCARAFLCPEQDSNLHTSRHAHLKRTRLPIPPSGQKKRAENETRTRDPNLGKVVLYQLSYFRNFFFVIRRIIRSLNRKRVQKYCFFLTYANFSAFFLHFFAFYGAVRVRVRTLYIIHAYKGQKWPEMGTWCVL